MMRKTTLSLGIMAATVAVCTVLFVWPITPRVPVETVLVARGSLLHTQTMTATAMEKNASTAIVLSNGQVESVCVSPGDWVKRGDALLRLDATAERRQLEALLRQKHALQAQTDGALAAIAAQSEAMLDASVSQAISALEMKTVRALADGQVRQVYLQSGDLVSAGSAAMMTADDGVELLAAERATAAGQLQCGMRALVTNGEKQLGTAQIAGFGAPQYDETLRTYIQSVRLDYHGEAIDPGERVQVRLCTQVRQDAPLVPMAAVSESGRVWVVENGRASCRVLDCSIRDDENVLGADELVGLSVVLAPDESRLQNGCGVKERKP